VSASVRESASVCERKSECACKCKCECARENVTVSARECV